MQMKLNEISWVFSITAFLPYLFLSVALLLPQNMDIFVTILWYAAVIFPMLWSAGVAYICFQKTNLTHRLIIPAFYVSLPMLLWFSAKFIQ